jgi:acylphosphatase
MVEGRVQGVGYRAACCARAQELGLGGWVRNLTDGRVELEAEGGSQQLNDLRLWCEIGPPLAEVRCVSTLPVGTTGEDWFEVRR